MAAGVQANVDVPVRARLLRFLSLTAIIISLDSSRSTPWRSGSRMFANAATTVAPADLLKLTGCSSQLQNSKSTVNCALKGEFALRSGPSATLADNTLLRSSTAACTGAAPGDSGCASLDLASLSNILVIRQNGKLELRGLQITGALLPTSPWPLPSTSFMVPLAVRLTSSSGSPLVISNSVIITPSCTALALHQAFACNSVPGPSFSIVPGFLRIHSFITPTVSLTNVTLRCTGTILPTPCVAAVASPPTSLHEAIMTLQQQVAAIANNQPQLWEIPASIYITGNMQLARSNPGSNNILFFKKLNITGASKATTTLDLMGFSVVYDIDETPTTVTLSKLTLRNMPLGASRTPEAVAQLSLWTFKFPRNILGYSKGTRLYLRDAIIVGLPRSEMYYYLQQFYRPLVDDVTGDPLVLSLKPWRCLTGVGGAAGSMEGNLVPDAGDVYFQLQSAGGRSGTYEFTDVVVRLGPKASTPIASAQLSADGRSTLQTEPFCRLQPVGVRELVDVRDITISPYGVSPRAFSNDHSPVLLCADCTFRGIDFASGWEGYELLLTPTALIGNSPSATFVDLRGITSGIIISGGGSITIRDVTLLNAPPADGPYWGEALQLGEYGPPPPPFPATQLLPSAMLNFTSCLWTLRFDRPAAASFGLGKGPTGDINGRPVGLPYAFLDSVRLVVPPREVLLLAWAMAANSTAAATDPGLAAQMAALIRDSRVAGRPFTAPQAQYRTNGVALLSSITSFTFAQLSWCGLQGSNVTITSQLPSGTSLTVQPVSRTLPVSYPGPRPPPPKKGKAGR